MLASYLNTIRETSCIVKVVVTVEFKTVAHAPSLEVIDFLYLYAPLFC